MPGVRHSRLEKQDKKMLMEPPRANPELDLPGPVHGVDHHLGRVHRYHQYRVLPDHQCRGDQLPLRR